MSRNNEIINEQVSFILLDKLLISFQEQYDDCIGEVVSRLKNKKGIIRSAGSSFMMYTIMDVIIDNYFGLLYKMGDDLDTIEELLYRKNDNRNIMIRTQDIKRVMITIRRAAWPERDKINDILRSESVLIAPETKTFYKDVYDHCMQVVDLVESYKDVTTTLVDTNLSFQSNRMNEIMKFLTIISSIFIPLTFIAGVYGMNFSYTDPGSGKILHNNMPELYEENGYLYSLYGMAIIAIVQIIYFWRRGWFR
jgi:magnesium transporter